MTNNKQRKFRRKTENEKNTARSQGNKVVQQMANNDKFLDGRITDVRNALAADIARVDESVNAINRATDQFFKQYTQEMAELKNRLDVEEKRNDILTDLFLEQFPDYEFSEEQIIALGLEATEEVVASE